MVLAVLMLLQLPLAGGVSASGNKVIIRVSAAISLKDALAAIT
jgi:hypothetical protein